MILPKRLVASVLAAICIPVAEAATDGDTLTLPNAVALALTANPDIRLSELAVASYQAGMQSADTAPNPTFTVGTSNLNTQAGIGSGNLRSKTFDTSVRIDQLIERGDKRRLRTENAAALTSASRFDAREVRRQTMIAVTFAFYDLLAAQERQEIAMQNASLMGDTLLAARKRRTAGDLAPSDVTRIEVDALRTDNDAGQAVAEEARARIVLAQLLGDARRATGLSVAGDWPARGLQLTPDTEVALAERADVRAAQARLDAARAAARLASAALQRDVTVGLQYDHFPGSTTNMQGNGNSIGVSIQIPLFLRNQYTGEIRSAAVAVETAALVLERTREAARGEILRQVEDARASIERLTRFDERLLPAARTSAAAAEFAFQHGAISVMDVLDVRRTYRQALLDALSARTDQAKTAAAMAWLSKPEVSR